MKDEKYFIMKDEEYFIIFDYLKKEIETEKDPLIRKGIIKYYKKIRLQFFKLLCNKIKLSKIIIKNNKKILNKNNWETTQKIIAENQINIINCEQKLSLLENYFIK